LPKAKQQHQGKTSSSSPKVLSSPEQLFDIRQFQFDIGRAAVVALAAVGRALHFAQERIHFVGIETAAGADAGMAGERGGDGF